MPADLSLYEGTIILHFKFFQVVDRAVLYSFSLLIPDGLSDLSKTKYPAPKRLGIVQVQGIFVESS